jgi:nucleoside-diphosphate-sugar epimerase
VRLLTAQGHTVFAYGRRPVTALAEPLPRYEQWDLCAGPTQAAEVEAVIHCAARVGDWGTDADYRRVNVQGTRVVLETFDGCERFVHVSSASVYSGDRPNRQLTEDASVGSRLYTAYARTKAEAEQLVLASGRPVVVLRPHIVYGPGDTTLMPRVLAARRLGCLAVPGNGRNRISITHVFNFVHAVECVLKSSVTHGTFNIADAEDASVDDLLRTLLPRCGITPRLLYVPRSIAWVAALMSERAWRLAGRSQAPRLTRYLVAKLADEHTLDSTRARTLLGYEPRHTFRDGPMHQESRS